MLLRLLANKMPKGLWRAGPTRERGSVAELDSLGPSFRS